MPPENETLTVLAALVGGALLKSHRFLDGSKCFRLHPLDAPPREVSKATVDALLKHGFVTSNQKFPAATYMLTPEGHAAAVRDT